MLVILITILKCACNVVNNHVRVSLYQNANFYIVSDEKFHRLNLYILSRHLMKYFVKSLWFLHSVGVHYVFPVDKQFGKFKTLNDPGKFTSHLLVLYNFVEGEKID